jgi:uncharacterized membrane protein YedE/YeeE
MILLLYFGGELGVSANLRTICTIGGAGKFSEFFQTDWKKQIWNLVFVLGMIIGGAIAANWLEGSDGNLSHISPETVVDMQSLGIDIKEGAVPMVPEFFNWHSLKSWVLLSTGGFMVGFGARYAGGCTSGHVISGLSNLQPPSLIAVTGFFIGGLFMTFVLFPLIF